MGETVSAAYAFFSPFVPHSRHLLCPTGPHVVLNRYHRLQFRHPNFQNQSLSPHLTVFSFLFTDNVINTKLKCMGQHSSMSEDRIQALQKLAFVWNSHDAVWEERLVELKQYRSMFGDTNVPSSYESNPKLAIWVKRQRRQKKFLDEGKPSTMTPYRVAKLSEIEFSWSGRKPKTE